VCGLTSGAFGTWLSVDDMSVPHVVACRPVTLPEWQLLPLKAAARVLDTWDWLSRLPRP